MKLLLGFDKLHMIRLINYSNIPFREIDACRIAKGNVHNTRKIKINSSLYQLIFVRTSLTDFMLYPFLYERVAKILISRSIENPKMILNRIESSKYRSYFMMGNIRKKAPGRLNDIETD